MHGGQQRSSSGGSGQSRQAGGGQCWSLSPTLGFSPAWRALQDHLSRVLSATRVCGPRLGLEVVHSPGDPSCPSGSDLQSSHCTLGEAFEDLDWETEKGLEAVACDTEGFVPPKVMVRSGRLYAIPIPACPGLEGGGPFSSRSPMALPGDDAATTGCLAVGDNLMGPPTARWLQGGWALSSSPCCLQLISSKVPKAEYIPTIIRRDDPSIIPILYVSDPPPAPGSGLDCCPRGTLRVWPVSVSGPRACDF